MMMYVELLSFVTRVAYYIMDVGRRYLQTSPKLTVVAGNHQCCNKEFPVTTVPQRCHFSCWEVDMELDTSCYW